ncbi:uncharacterized protein SETTUDRAFT_19097 [Exserohilum turcica Et28A]|uniref:Uncharacterized protein n=1 Tax=Exserohilum turcicum (strain 28A) TaxID=671987 RepID=R0KEN1_EXST2|nr:uncharacterized protein SETTUDRAFT_19097 [Exserohilum turcica Et28A]EOA86582.1 hypothetical protein SETTUDRAFT_19097 [Exserohilum turcica Et28A]
MANKPIDPLRMRLFSELNIQLAPHCIDKDTMNETSKHLAFLTRCYLNTPDPNPLAASIPIVKDCARGAFGFNRGGALGLSISFYYWNYNCNWNWYCYFGNRGKCTGYKSPGGTRCCENVHFDNYNYNYNDEYNDEYHATCDPAVPQTPRPASHMPIRVCGSSGCGSRSPHETASSRVDPDGRFSGPLEVSDERVCVQGRARGCGAGESRRACHEGM